MKLWAIYQQGFYENAHIISHSDIKCDYMLNTTALAYGGIYLEGKRGSVIGGDVTGVRGICIKLVEVSLF